MAEIPIEKKRSGDSRHSKVMPFSSDSKLRDQHINIFGDLRFGLLLEELDKAAGRTAYTHADGLNKKLAIVTAACDRIDLIGPLKGDRDLRICGEVNWVGRTSMEIRVSLESKIDSEYEVVSLSYFIMVARFNNEAAPVNQLLLNTEEEKQRFDEGEARQDHRRDMARNNFMRKAPNEDEGALLHDLFLNIKNNNISGVFMRDTYREATILMHLQDRNSHNKIFGGYIMRQSFELAWNVAYLFCRKRPLFVCADRFNFYKPVEIGAIVSFQGMVIYTGETSYIVEIIAEVINPNDEKTEVTNVAYFTFVAMEPNNQQRKKVPAILPHTYEEGLKYLEGARCYERGKQIHQMNKR